MDSEEERRVFYVGMTRARETLAVFNRKDIRDPLTADLSGPCFTSRRFSGTAVGTAIPSARQYALLGLKDLYIDYLGGRSPSDPSSCSLRTLQPGARLKMSNDGDKIQLIASSGQAVAQLSSEAVKEWGPRLSDVSEVRMLGSFVRIRADVDEAYAGRIRSEEWEVPICEVVSTCLS